MSWQEENQRLLEQHVKRIEDIRRYIEKLQQKYEDTQEKVRKLVVIGMRLGDLGGAKLVTSWDALREAKRNAEPIGAVVKRRVAWDMKREAVRNAERSARAELRLRWKALKHAEYTFESIGGNGGPFMFLGSPPPRDWVPDEPDPSGPDPSRDPWLTMDEDDARAASEPPENLTPQEPGPDAAGGHEPTTARPGLKEVLKAAAAHRGGKSGRP
jgi:hypothetical protein